MNVDDSLMTGIYIFDKICLFTCILIYIETLGILVHRQTKSKKISRLNLQNHTMSKTFKYYLIFENAIEI